jgi:hypothetical protein
MKLYSREGSELVKEPGKGYVLPSNKLEELMSPEGYDRLTTLLAKLQFKYRKELNELNSKEIGEANERINKLLGGVNMENGTIDAMVILNKLQAKGVDITKAVKYLESLITNQSGVVSIE